MGDAGKGKAKSPRSAGGKPGHGKPTTSVRIYIPDRAKLSERTRQTGKPAAQLIEEMMSHTLACDEKEQGTE